MLRTLELVSDQGRKRAQARSINPVSVVHHSRAAGSGHVGPQSVTEGTPVAA